MWLFVTLLVFETLSTIKKQNDFKKSDAIANLISIRKVSEAFHDDLWTVPWNEYKPNSEVKVVHNGETYETKINNHGFRGNNFLDRKNNKNLKYIVCLGGSSTVAGKNNSNTYPAYLENTIRNSNDNFRVINAGVAGSTTGNYRKILSRLPKSIDVQYVIIHNAINDIVWYLMPKWIDQQNQIQKLLLKSNFINYYFGDLFTPSDKLIRKSLRNSILSNIKTLAIELEKKDIQVFITSFIYPNLEDANKNDAQRLNLNLRYQWNSSNPDYISSHISLNKYCQIIDYYNQEIQNVFAESKTTFLPLNKSIKLRLDEFKDICHLEQSGIKKKGVMIADLFLDSLSNHRN